MRELQNLAAGFGRGVLAIGSGGITELRRRDADEAAARKQEQLKQLSGILSQQSIPEFARAGGSMALSPQEIEQTQLRQLSALGTPAAAEIIAQRSPLTQKPQTVQQKQQFGLSEKKFALEQKKFDQTVTEFNKKAEAGFLIPKDAFDMAQKLRKEFTGLSGEFIKQRDAFARVQASVEDPSAAGDLALIFNFMKVLDPGSTVREGEFATAANSAGIPDRIRAQYNKVSTGERLADKQRNDFSDRANKLFTRANSQHNKRVENFTGVAERAGLNVEDVLLDLGLAEQKAATQRTPQSPQATGEGTIATNPQTGAKLILRGGQWQPL